MTLNEFFSSLNNGARWDVGVSINRSNALPLDANSVFASLEAAQAYVAGTAEGVLANAYPGQVLAVVTENETTVYYVDAKMALQPLADASYVDTKVQEAIALIPEVKIDNETIVKNDEGELTVHIDDKTIKSDEEDGSLYVHIDGDTIKAKEDGTLYANIVIPEVTVDDKSVNKTAEGDIQILDFDKLTAADDKKLLRYNSTTGKVEWAAVSDVVEGDTNTVTRGDGKSTEDKKAEDKDELTISLYGYEEAKAGDVPMKGADGKLTYVNLEDTIAEAIDEIPEQIDYTVTVEADSTPDHSLKCYKFYQGVNNDGTKKEIAHIDIPKDLVVSSGEVIVATEADKALDDKVVPGETYIKLIVANQEKPLYIAAKDLVDIYTEEENAAQVQLDISDDNVISATIVAGSINLTELHDDVLGVLGLAESALQDSDIKFTANTLNGDDYTYTVSVKGNTIKAGKYGNEEVEVDLQLASPEYVEKAIDIATGDFGEKTIKTYVDDEFAKVPGLIEGAIAELDIEDAAVDNEYVSSVKQVDGKIEVSRVALPRIEIKEEKGDATNISFIGQLANTGHHEITAKSYVIDSYNGDIAIGTGTGNDYGEGLTLNIKANAVDTENIADSAITTEKIANGAVTAEKLGADVETYVQGIVTPMLPEIPEIPALAIENTKGDITQDGAIFVGGIAEVNGHLITQTNYCIVGNGDIVFDTTQGENQTVLNPNENQLINLALSDAIKSTINSAIQTIQDADGNAWGKDGCIVTVPFANDTVAGIVKTSDEIGLNDQHQLEVKAVNVNKLTQTKGEWLILNGGDAALTWPEDEAEG